MIKNMKKRLKDQRGLTLVELLAVIVILGIISAIAIPSIGGIIQKSKEDAVKADAIAILNAAKMHVSSTNLTPDEDSITADHKKGTITMGKAILVDYVDSKYFTSKNSKTFSVIYDIDSKAYELTTATDIGEGLTFAGATLEEINNHSDRSDKTIGD